jgi:hypothetical protein
MARTLPRWYIVQAHVAPGGRQVPTFYLDAWLLGIDTLARAESIARDIIEAGWNIGPTVSRIAYIHVSVAEDMPQ